MHDLIVLGGGPAGLTATMYAIQKRLDVLLITRDLGGKTNFRLQLPFVERHMIITGDEIVSRFTREIEYLDSFRWMDNASQVTQVPGGFRVKTSSGMTTEAHTLLVATGAKPQMLDVPGEREYMMRGLCYSAVSYAQLFIDRSVVVIGNADLALRAVAELARIAQRVTLVTPDTSGFSPVLQRKVLSAPNVELLSGYEIQRIVGDRYARKVVITAADHTREIEMDAAFVELDLIPRSDIVKHLVDLDERGHIKINARCETSTPGVYAAGDVTDSYAEQVLIAVGEGAKAALSAYEHLLSTEQPEMEQPG
jgi:thioredoxin reductase